MYDKKQDFHKNFCLFSYKYYERLKNDISKILNNKDFLLSQNIILLDDINNLLYVETCLGNILEHSDFQNISIQIENKKFFFDNYIMKLLTMINYDNKKMIFENQYIESLELENSKTNI